MRIHLRSREHARRVAKSLQDHFPELSLTTAQAWTAQMLGYRDDHELTTVTKQQRVEPSPRDEACSPEEREARRQYQAATLARCSGIELSGARAIVDVLGPSGMRDGASLNGQMTQIAEMVDALQLLGDGRDLKQIEATIKAVTKLLDAPATGRSAELIAESACVRIAQAILALERPTDTMIAFMERVAEHGAPTFAYNLANLLLERRKPGDVERAAQCYQRVIADSDAPDSMCAASCVNYAAVVRDGLVTGHPDWPGAVKLYEQAARMGMVVAMFNAGNVCTWMGDKGDTVAYDRAQRWFAYAIEHVAAGKPTLDFNGEDQLKNAVTQCRRSLAALHIDGLCQNANVNVGIRMLDDLADAGDATADRFRNVGYFNRFRQLTGKPRTTPGGNWKYLLTAMGWRFGPGRTGHEGFVVGPGQLFEAEVFHALRNRTERNVPALAVVVVAADLLPQEGGLRILGLIAQQAAERFPNGCLVLAAKALFRNLSGRVYTPVSLCMPGREPQFVSLNKRADTPDRLIAQLGVPLGSAPEHGDDNQTVSMAYNALSEGVRVSAMMASDEIVPFVGVGGDWCMPVYDHQRLLREHRILIDAKNGRAYTLDEPPAPTAR